MLFEALKQIKDDMVCDMWLALKLDMDMWVPWNESMKTNDMWYDMSLWYGMLWYDRHLVALKLDD